MVSGSNIHFFFQHHSVNLNKRSVLKAFISDIFKKEKRKLNNLNYIFCTDKELLKITRTFLKHNYYTDVITFNLSVFPKEIDAEIYISVDRIKDNAKLLGLAAESELHRVVFHGALHLCGYGDKKKEEAVKMRAKEEFYLSRYFK